MDAEDEVFDLNNDMDPPILSLVSIWTPCIVNGKFIKPGKFMGLPITHW